MDRTTRESLEFRITVAKDELDQARNEHDELRANLLEDALNDLLEQLKVTLVTRN